MATHGALAEYDEISSENIGSFHGYVDGRTAIKRIKIVFGAYANALAAMDVHGVVDRLAATFGGMIFHNGRGNRWLPSLIETGNAKFQRRKIKIGIGADAR